MRHCHALPSLLFAAALAASTVSAQAVQIPARPPHPPESTVRPPGVLGLELAGRPLSGYPHFQFVRAFHEGSIVRLAIDPTRHPGIAGRTAHAYVVAAKTAAEWDADPSLLDVAGGPRLLTFSGASIQANTFVLDSGQLSGNAGTGLGVGYDVVIDLDLNAALDPGDFIDGYGEEAGFYVLADTSQPGPLPVTEITYSGGSFLGQNTFYPANIGALGQLPLVVVSHGNGHNYSWYDHIGTHLASYGYVVMSHQNDTGPGSNAASITTLTNTDYILANQATINGGVLDGHIDSTRISWIGHSRGGEGVVRAYVRLLNDEYISPNFDEDDIVFISSMAPVTHISSGLSFPDEVNFQLFYGSSDDDVTGSPSSFASKPFAFYERAWGNKHTNYIQGMGHAYFHNGTTSCVCTGPNTISRPVAHDYVKGLFLPLIKLYVEGNLPALDFFERMPDDFRPAGSTGSLILAADYREAVATGNFFVDDFQANPSVALSSSGGAVSFTVSSVSEGVMSDQDGSFDYSASVPMNGMTRYDDAGDDGRAVVFEWAPPGAFYYEQAIVPAEADLSDDAHLSFRACQGTRHPATNALDGPLSFTVTLRDTLGATSSIDTGNYGGITRTYERTGSGSGAGWANEFSTTRLRLTDFLTDGSGLDLSSIEAIRFEFGAGFGSERGRLGMDDIEIIRQ